MYLPSVDTTAESSDYPEEVDCMLVVDLKLCNQERKWSAAEGILQGSTGNYGGGTQLLLRLLSVPF